MSENTENKFPESEELYNTQDLMKDSNLTEENEDKIDEIPMSSNLDFDEPILDELENQIDDDEAAEDELEDDVAETEDMEIAEDETEQTSPEESETNQEGESEVTETGK
jgi:hypothetical protein